MGFELAFQIPCQFQGLLLHHWVQVHENFHHLVVQDCLQQYSTIIIHKNIKALSNKINGLIDYFLSCNYSLVLYYLFIITYFIVALIFITTRNYRHKSVSFRWWRYRWRVLFRKHEIIVVLVVIVFSIVDMVVSIVGSVVAIIVIGINWVLSRTVVRNVPILAICMVMEKKLCRYISQIIRYLFQIQQPKPNTLYNKTN